MLPQKTASQLTDMELNEYEKIPTLYMGECEETTMPYMDECEETTIHDVNIEEIMKTGHAPSKDCTQLTNMELDEYEDTTMPYMGKCEDTAIPYMDECEETTMHDVNIEEMIRTKMLMMTPRWCNVTSIRRS